MFLLYELFHIENIFDSLNNEVKKLENQWSKNAKKQNAFDN